MFLALIVAFSACSKDDDNPTCAQSDWVGTYTGTIDCDGTMENVTLTITASGTDAVIISYETPTLTTDYDPLTPDGCNISVSGSLGGISSLVEATLDGNELTLLEELSGGGITSTCNLTVTK